MSKRFNESIISIQSVSSASRAPDQVEDIMATSRQPSSLATAEFTKGHIQVDDRLRCLCWGLSQWAPSSRGVKGWKAIYELRMKQQTTENEKHVHYMPKKS